MTQAKSNETTIGTAYGIQLTEGEKNEINFGMWYRLKDALIPYIGYQKSGFQVGLSYDYTVSSLKTGAQVRNGCELTLIYSAPDRSELKRLIPWYWDEAQLTSNQEICLGYWVVLFQFGTNVIMWLDCIVIKQHTSFAYKCYCCKAVLQYIRRHYFVITSSETPINTEVLLSAYRPKPNQPA